MAESSDTVVGRLAVDRDYLTSEQLADALDTQRKAREDMGLDMPLVQVLVNKHLLTPDQAQELRNAAAVETGEARLVAGYEVVSKLGQGGMGAVYRARRLDTGQYVALKILPPSLADPQLIARFKREAEITSKLDHDHIVGCVEFGYDPKRKCHFCALELVEGENLHQHIKRAGVLPEEETLSITEQLAMALQHAFYNGLVHRDVKPENVMLTPDGTAKLLDLGLARPANMEATRLTQSGMFVGSPYYASPEQALGEREVDIRSDIYSLGATVYHMVTGRPPFGGTTALQILQKHVNEMLPWPADINPDVSDGLCLIIARMMAKSPDDRYQTPTDLLDDLELLEQGGEPEIAEQALRRSSIAPAVKPRTKRARPASAGRLASAGRKRPPSGGHHPRAHDGRAARESARTSAPPAAGPVDGRVPSLVSRWQDLPLWMKFSVGVGAAGVIAIGLALLMGGKKRGAAEVPEPIGRGPSAGPALTEERNAADPFDRAKRYAAANPDDPEGAFALFDGVVKDFPGSPEAAEARERIDKLLGRGKAAPEVAPAASADSGVALRAAEKWEAANPANAAGAIARYERVARDFPGTPEAGKAELNVIRLKAGESARLADEDERNRRAVWRMDFGDRASVMRGGVFEDRGLPPGSRGAVRQTPDGHIGTREIAGKDLFVFGEGQQLHCRFKLKRPAYYQIWFGTRTAGEDSRFLKRHGPQPERPGAWTEFRIPLDLGSDQFAQRLSGPPCRPGTMICSIWFETVVEAGKHRDLGLVIDEIWVTEPVPGGTLAGEWRPLFDGKTTDCLWFGGRRVSWRVEDGALVHVPGPANAPQTKKVFEDGRLRIRFVAGAGVQALAFRMRQGGEGSYDVSPRLTGAEQELVFTCSGDDVTATLDRAAVPVTARGRSRSGCLQINARSTEGRDGLRILAIDYCPSVAAPPSGPAPPDAVEFGGHFYKLFRSGMTWHDAKRFCEEKGGHLVTITSKEENDFVVNIARAGNRNTWIGFSDERIEGRWEWVTGERGAFTNWQPGEPSNAEAKENYGSLVPFYGWKWNDNNVEGFPGPQPFICEWERGGVAAAAADDLDLARGLVGWWKFDEGKGAVARDSSGKGNDGKIVGGAKWANGKVGGALEFDGRDDHVHCGNPPGVSSMAEYTVAAWVRPDDTSIAMIRYGDSIVSKEGFGRGFQLTWAGDRFGLMTLSVRDVLWSRRGKRNGQWYHLVGSWSAGDGMARLYVDGTMEAQAVRRYAPNAAEALRIGDFHAGGRAFGGTVDDVRIYNRALSAGEVAALYRAPERVGAEKAGTGKLDSILAEFDALLEERDYAGARALASREWKKPENTSVEEALGAAVFVARILEKRQETIRRAAEALVGKQAKLMTTKGLRRGEVKEVTDDGLVVVGKIIINRKVVGENRFEVGWSDLAPEEEDRLAEGWDPAGANGYIARAVVALVRKDADAAAEALGLAAGHPLAAHYRAKLEALRGAKAPAKREKETEPEEERSRKGWPPGARAIQRLFRGRVLRWDPKTLVVELFYDFEDPKQEKDWSLGAWGYWTKLPPGSMQVADGRLHMLATNRCALLRGRYRSVLAEMEFAVEGAGHVQLLAAADGGGSFYAVGVTTTGRVYQEKYVAGKSAAFPERKTVPPAATKNGRMSISFSPGRLRGSVGDAKLEAEDTSLDSGQVGFRAHDTRASFDNLRVRGQLDRAWLERELGLPVSRGLVGTYFEGTNLRKAVVRRVDLEVDLSWGTEAPASGVPQDGFSVRWEGYIVPPVTGTYVFTIESDDGARMWIAGRPAVDAWAADRGTRSSGGVAFEKGKSYPLRLEYMESTGSACVRLLWTAPGTPAPVPVPSDCLRPPPNYHRLPGPAFVK